MGGIIGLFFNGLFADNELIALDGVNTSVPGGWTKHNWKQMYIQIAYIGATVGYTFVVTALLAKGLDMIPYFSLRSSVEDEALGMDDTQIGEFVSDYVELRRDYRDWTAGEYNPQANAAADSGTTLAAAGDRHGHPELPKGVQPPHPSAEEQRPPGATVPSDAEKAALATA